jgi:capsular exopolysaccharide synthesis family protein
MSRIDEALARAAAAGKPESRRTEASVSSDLSSPWDLGAADVTDTPPIQELASGGPGPVSVDQGGAVLSEHPAEVIRTPAVQEPLFITRLEGETLEKLVVTPLADARWVEQYRRSAAVLHLAQAERGIKVVLVASAAQGEGKTLTATNIALTLSESYRRSVLLIDADLRRPTIHSLFNIPNFTGLSDGLKSATERKIMLVPYSEHLSILPAGRPDSDPMSALTSDRMRRVVQEAAGSFDWVVIDTPPIGFLPDAHLLAAMADVVLLVVQAGKTPCASVSQAIAAIGRDRILGIVLNRVAAAPAAAGEEYYSYVRADLAAERGVISRSDLGSNG